MFFSSALSSPPLLRLVYSFHMDFPTPAPTPAAPVGGNGLPLESLRDPTPFVSTSPSGSPLPRCLFPPNLLSPIWPRLAGIFPLRLSQNSGIFNFLSLFSPSPRFLPASFFRSPANELPSPFPQEPFWSRVKTSHNHPLVFAVPFLPFS